MKTTRLLLVMLAAVAALSVGETLIARGMRQAGDASTGLVGRPEDGGAAAAG